MVQCYGNTITLMTLDGRKELLFEHQNFDLLGYLSYGSDLAHIDFLLFPNMKEYLKKQYLKNGW